MPFVSIKETVEPCNKLDPLYRETKRATEITKNFIADRGLICYGGTALDYAARLSGSKIYDDSKLDLPDLDFYSLDPVKDARDLADILYSQGFLEARMIRAVHVGTFRVDSGGNHFVADVSYCPIIAELKTMKYENFLVVDPIYQRIDMHSSMSFPYDGSPQEVIFNRWKKDIERFNIIAALYPLIPGDNKNNIIGKDIILNHSIVYTGQIAYDLFFGSSDLKVNVIEICSKDPEETIGDLDLTVVSEYEQYFNLLPQMYFCNDPAGNKYIVYSTEERLLSRSIINIGTFKQRLSCMSFVLKIFLGWSLISDRGYPWKPDYYSHEIELYNKLLEICKLSIEVYGHENIDHNMLMKIEELEAKINGTKFETSFPLPGTYRPSKGNREAELPFDYRSNPMLQITGIKKD